ncbi:Uma2 family endonuclease [Algoriphagus marincola]|uniref:Uma2 family endonuclease n=1 Tax=Algoriphagus marincola TaxID=264027 RepID=A0ABS7N4S6_9BACT|nr:Uma2 family endonuclease [Algoriphagus marincola]MBY5950195.1 Uma2 family endonuclease [Algoriphagus marincola]
MEANKPVTVNEPEAEYQLYSYSDYLTWQFDEVVELIRGKIFKKAAAAPKRIHQRISLKLATKFYTFLEGEKCHVYEAPFDVRFPKTSNEDSQIFDVVQPDICVICDLKKLDDRGCLGAPDLIVEILSPSNNETELRYKFDLYESQGVKEYWIVSPENQTFTINTLIDQRYVTSRMMTSGDVVESAVIKGFSLNLKSFFEGID